MVGEREKNRVTRYNASIVLGRVELVSLFIIFGEGLFRDEHGLRAGDSLS